MPAHAVLAMQKKKRKRSICIKAIRARRSPPGNPVLAGQPFRLLPVWPVGRHTNFTASTASGRPAGGWRRLVHEEPLVHESTMTQSGDQFPAGGAHWTPREEEREGSLGLFMSRTARVVLFFLQVTVPGRRGSPLPVDGCGGRDCIPPFCAFAPTSLVTYTIAKEVIVGRRWRPYIWNEV